MSLFKTATKGVAWTTLSTVIRSAASLLQVSILTRFLPKSDFGIVAIATLFISFTQIFLDFGISSGILFKKEISAREYSSLFWLNVFFGIFLTIILVLLSPVVATIYKEPSLRAIVPLLSLTILFSSMGSQHRTVQQKKLRFNYIAIVEIFAAICSVAVAIALAILGKGIYSLIFSTLTNVIVSNSLFLVIGLRKDNQISFHFNFRETFPFLKIGVYSVGSQVLDFFSREVDTIIISAAFSKEALGLYNLCKRLISALYGIILPVVNKVLPPILAGFQSGVDSLRRIYYSIIQSMAIFFMPLFCIVACFSRFILNVLYGESYIVGGLFTSLLAVYYGQLTPGASVTSLQIATGRTDAGFYWTIARIIINSCAIFLSARLGMEWMVVMLLGACILSSPIAWAVTIRPIIQGNFFQYFVQTFFPTVLSVVVAVPFYLGFAQTLSFWTVLGAGSLLAMCSYLLEWLFFPNSYLFLKGRELIKQKK